MAAIHEQFAEALRSRLNGEFEALVSASETCCPSHARQAGVEADVITAATAEALGLEFTESLADRPASHEFLSKVPIGFARRHGLLGLADGGGTMRLAMADLGQWPQVQAIAKTLGREVIPLFAPRGEILRAINAAYELQTGQAERVIEELDADDVLRQVDEVSRSEDLLDVASRAPVIKLVNLILFEAVKRRASDVHIQPYEDRLLIPVWIRADVGLPLEVSPSPLDLGTLAVGERREARVTVTNRGERPARLLYATVAAPGCLARVPREAIPPGGKISLPLVVEARAGGTKRIAFHVATDLVTQRGLAVVVRFAVRPEMRLSRDAGGEWPPLGAASGP